MSNPDEFDNLTDVCEIAETSEEKDESANDGEVINGEDKNITLGK